MAKIITLLCLETPGLKLGPNAEIVFDQGYADVDTEQYPQWAEWAYHPGSPFIRALSGDEGNPATGGLPCPTCGKVFKNQKSLNAHLLSHRPKK